MIFRAKGNNSSLVSVNGGPAPSKSQGGKKRRIGEESMRATSTNALVVSGGIVAAGPVMSWETILACKMEWLLLVQTM